MNELCSIRINLFNYFNNNLNILNAMFSNVNRFEDSTSEIGRTLAMVICHVSDGYMSR